MKPGEKRRPWSIEEETELRHITGYTLNGRRLRGHRDEPMGLLKMFADKHGRTYSAVLKKAQRLHARSYQKRKVFQ